jgi:hypothetical protein
VDAVILCEFPSDNADLRSWMLDRVAILSDPSSTVHADVSV